MYCKVYCPTELNDLLHHCKTCNFMPRPDQFRHKFVCYRCQYFSYQSTNMKNHLKIHLGEKPFTCPTCGMRFRTNDHYRKHSRTHC